MISKFLRRSCLGGSNAGGGPGRPAIVWAGNDDGGLIGFI